MNLRTDARTMQVLVGLLLLAGTVVLAVRSVGTVDEVLSVRSVTVAPVHADVDRFEAVARTMELRRDRLETAEAGPRDPFRDPPVSARTVAPVQPAPRREVLPELQAVVFYNVRPAVKLRIGRSGSPWLGQGERFKGWTVVKIEPGSAQVSDGVRQLELSLN
jgi:hypothetical protein